VISLDPELILTAEDERMGNTMNPTLRLLHQQCQHPSRTQSNQQGKMKFSQKNENSKQYVSPDYNNCEKNKTADSSTSHNRCHQFNLIKS
jgi:hypothetical protein